MRAIGTKYGGCYFRSRLEARWAVFFDHLGIEWLYEPEGFEKDMMGDVKNRYLPDFFLPRTKTWVEVKGSLGKSDAMKMGDMLDWGCPMDGIDESFDHDDARGLLMLGTYQRIQEI